MWMQNKAVFMDIQPMQRGLQADRMPVSLRMHTSPSGQTATLLSPQPEPHLNQSTQNPSNSQESRDARKLSELGCFS